MQLLSRLSISYKLSVTILILISMSFSMTAQKKLPTGFCITNMEKELFDKINQLRNDYGKTQMQLSSSLAYVAELHVADLQNNNPDTSICNLSSWSNNGNWTACCYNKYLHNPDCMWGKPKELTPYPYRGYELVTFLEEDFNTDSIINLWSDSKEVLDMILTRGNYAKKKWICAGVGISDNYVSLWFGQRKDKLKEPIMCDTANKTNDTAPNTLAINKTNTYYLIFGSHNSMHGAREARKEVKADFKNCDILVKNDKYRVYLNKFDNLKEAMYAKQQLPFEYREAWILKE